MTSYVHGQGEGEDKDNYKNNHPRTYLTTESSARQKMIDFQKLRREWKTFVLAVLTTIGGAWTFAVANGADLPNLLAFVPDQYRSGAIFLIGVGFLVLRKYTDQNV